MEIIKDHLESLENSSCGPAMIRTMLKAGLQLRGKDLQTAPSQKEIGKEVYTWKYGIFTQPLRLRDNWCLPKDVCQYLRQSFESVSFYDNGGGTVEAMAKLLKQGKAVGVLIQDVVPDKGHPQGFKDSLDNGHWTIVKAVNQKEGWVELADSYRNKPGNERWFDDQGLVLTDGQISDRSSYTLEHRGIYRMNINEFVKNWWDFKFDQKEKYIHPMVAVDLFSFKA